MSVLLLTVLPRAQGCQEPRWCKVDPLFRMLDVSTGKLF